MNATQKYELIRPILMREKTPKQVNEEANIPLSSIYRYLKRFREGGGDIKSLEDKSHAIPLPESVLSISPLDDTDSNP